MPGAEQSVINSASNCEISTTAADFLKNNYTVRQKNKSLNESFSTSKIIWVPETLPRSWFGHNDKFLVVFLGSNCQILVIFGVFVILQTTL